MLIQHSFCKTPSFRSLIALGFVAILAAGLGHGAGADTTPPPANPAASGDATDESCTSAQKPPVTTEHQATIGGKAFSYSATVGFLEITVDPSMFAAELNPGGGAPSSSTPFKACVFFTSYQVHTRAGSAQRPLTFAFTGGPGSASLWLHLGMMAPKRVNMGDDGLHPPIPFELDDNADTPLDLTDIVMIDPVGTGFSHAKKGSTNDQFYGAQVDAESVATFIRKFTDTYKREDSPLYVMGESYGGMRGSLVAQLMQQPLDLPLKGLILVSPCLSSTIYNFNEDDNDVPYYTFFPTFATTSWYQKRAAANYLSMDVESVYQAASVFASGPLRDALAKGNGLKPGMPEFESIAKQISDFTGIPQVEVENLYLRIRDTDYFGLLLKDQNEVVGRFDTRFVGRRLLRQDGTNATDPSDTGTGFIFVSAINDYIRNFLGFTTNHPYVDSADIQSWPMNSDSTEFVATHNLSQAFADNPNLQVFVASGYYDLACPMGTVEYERSRLDPGSNGRDRMAIHHYASGHMVYINPASLHQLKTDLIPFYFQTLSGTVVVGSK